MPVSRGAPPQVGVAQPAPHAQPDVAAALTQRRRRAHRVGERPAVDLEHHVAQLQPRALSLAPSLQRADRARALSEREAEPRPRARLPHAPAV